MDNQNLPAQTIDVPAVLNGLREAIPAEKQVSWLQLCDGKRLTIDTLLKEELRLQTLLIDYDKMEVLPLQNALEAYRKGATEMPEIRKGFTRYMDAITTEMMVPEKRVSSYENFIKATARYNELRIQNEKNQAANVAKSAELERFKAHAKNEYLRIEAEYTLLLEKHIVDSYTLALNDVNGLDANGVEQYLKTTESVLTQTKVGDPIKFIPYATFLPVNNENGVFIGYQHKDNKEVVIKKEELIQIHSSIERPNFASILESAKTSMRDKFKMYDNDRANATKAKESLLKEQEDNKKRIEQEQTQKSSVNNLLATGAAYQSISADGVKAIVRKKVIDCEDLTPTETMAIITGFTGNWAKVFINVSVKQLCNLKVEQMAAALDKGDVKVDGVRYKELTK